MNKITIFIDSDVVISSLLSEKGASFLLLHSIKSVERYISNYSQEELKKVAKRLEISEGALALFEKKIFQFAKLTKSLDDLKKEFSRYVKDINDAHIVAGATYAKAKFLITYNLKDFEIEAIRQDFGIITMTPANFLQYLRSI